QQAHANSRRLRPVKWPRRRAYVSSVSRSRQICQSSQVMRPRLRRFCPRCRPAGRAAEVPIVTPALPRYIALAPDDPPDANLGVRRGPTPAAGTEGIVRGRLPARRAAFAAVAARSMPAAAGPRWRSSLMRPRWLPWLPLLPVLALFAGPAPAPAQAKPEAPTF